MHKKATAEQTQKMLKKEQQQRLRIRIKHMEKQINESLVRQQSLINQIKTEEQKLRIRQNTLYGTEQQQLIDVDIRNSRIMSSVELQKQRSIMKQSNFEMASYQVPTFQQSKKQLEQMKNHAYSEMIPVKISNLIKYMKIKITLLQKLSKLKTDGNLFYSHQRVLFKEFLSELRVWNSDLEQKNNRIEQGLKNEKWIEAKFEESSRNLQLFFERV